MDPRRRGAEVATWPGPGPAEHLEVVVETAGRLPIPRLIVHLLDLVPGDLILVDREPAGLLLEPYREVLRRRLDLTLREPEDMPEEPPRERLSMVAPSVTLSIPRSDFPLAPGEILVWNVEDRGGSFRLSVHKKTAARPSP
jgi:bifunctional DNA-binding transcriptional regulator/antitoxin component of YhaV-PrlF toxin-antitoxin module